MTEREIKWFCTQCTLLTAVCHCGRSDVDVHTEAGSKKAENLFKELMLQVSTVQDSFRAQSSYVLEHTLDFCTACIQFKVTYL